MSAFGLLFAPDGLHDAVSGRSWLRAMLDAERGLAQAGVRAGVVPAADAAVIAAACTPDGLDWEQLLRDGRRAGAPVEPLVRELVARVGEDRARYVHLGATTQDIVDTAAMLVAYRALDLVLGELDRVTGFCADLAREHRDTPIAARTMLQQAVPTTFGLKAAVWLVAALDARARLAGLRATLPAQLGGAGGTLAAMGEHGLELARLFAGELGLAEPTLPWHTSRTPVAELGAALDVAAGTAAKAGLDVLLLAQTEVGEVREGGGGGSSTAMPQKRNAVGAMRARAAAELAHAYASVLLGALAQEHERAAGSWQAEWDALSGCLLYAGGAVAALAGSLEGLEVDRVRMRSNLDATGAIAAERIAIVLTGRLGSTKARTLVRDASLRAAETGRPLGEELALLDTGLEPDEIRAALEPTTYLGSAGALVDRALARWEAERGTRE